MESEKNNYGFGNLTYRDLLSLRNQWVQFKELLIVSDSSAYRFHMNRVNSAIHYYPHRKPR